MNEDQVTAPTADGAPAPHASDNVSVEVGNAAPLVVAKETPAAATEAVAAESVAAQNEADTDGTKKPPKLEPWAQKVVADAAFAEREAKRELKRVSDELAALKAPKPEPVATPNAADAAAAAAGAPLGGYKTDAEFNAAVEAATNRRAQLAQDHARQNEFNARSNDAATKGKAAFGADFETAVANLNQVGFLPQMDTAGRVQNAELLEMVLATEDPSKVLYELGSNPDKAASILGMTPQARAIEIAKLSIAAPKKPTPAALSNAPRPIPSVDGSARTTATPSDNDDDDTFFAKREAELKANGRW